jgi:beta-lactam-binding protein with PASTA domain
MAEEKDRNRGFFRFIISKKFFIQLGIAIGLGIVMFFVLTRYLSMYTDHGNELLVPDFTGLTIMQIDSAGFTDDYDFYVIDSLYDDDNIKGAVVIQNPLPGTKVKKGRNIYFTIVASTPEMVIMPDLKDLTLRQAINILESSNLSTGKLIYQPSFDKNAVLEQFFGKDTIFPGDTLIKGSVIDLVIGSGDRNYRIPVPFLIGLTRDEAIYELNIASFNLGNEFYMDTVKDEFARVYMQDPVWESEISYFPGDSVHLWYRSDTAFNFDEYMLQFLPDSLRPDTLAVDTEIEF